MALDSSPGVHTWVVVNLSGPETRCEAKELLVGGEEVQGVADALRNALV